MTAIDRNHTEKVLQRVAICAFTYYPGKSNDEPGYDVEEDVAWCTVPLERRLPGAELQVFRNVIRMLITESLADCRPFITKLAELAGDT
jgi:hypothetical protein